MCHQRNLFCIPCLSLAVIALGGVASCDRAPQEQVANHADFSSQPQWHAVSLTEIESSSEYSALYIRANEAKVAMESQLKSKLMEGIQSGGPAVAIEVCSKQAPLIADQISEAHQLSIGRTSAKLRQQSNTAPEWFGELSRLQASDTEESLIFTNTSGELGVAFPIHIAPPCMLCHGDRETLIPGVQQQLDSLYPHDLATGYQLGDLRGWFWVEVPTEN